MIRFAVFFIFGMLLTELSCAAPDEAQAIESVPLTGVNVANTTVDEYTKTYYGGERGSIKSWMALDWNGETLTCTPFKGFQKKPMPFDWNRQESKDFRVEPIITETTLFILKGPFGTGEKSTSSRKFAEFCKDGMTAKETIREGWKKAIRFNTTDLELRAEYKKAPDGKILPGSMRLLMTISGKPDSIILERAPGIIFSDQKFMWYGDINGDGLPDFLIQRTLITGEIDYVLSLSNTDLRYSVVGVTFDRDKPDMGFSSGVGELEYQEMQIRNSPQPFPVYTLPKITADTLGSKARKLAKSGNQTVSNMVIVNDPTNENSASEDTSKISVPPAKAEVKRDFVFTFNEEKYRLLVELVPNFCGEVSGPGYASQLYFGAYGGCPRSLMISIYYQGKRQVLLVTNTYMDGSMSMTAGDLDGSGLLSIAIDWLPHYNNSMNNVWKKATDGTRIMKRVSVFQSQGC